MVVKWLQVLPHGSLRNTRIFGISFLLSWFFVTIQQHRICVVAPRGYKFRLSRQAAQLSYISLLMGTSTLRRLLPSSYGTAE